MSKIPVSRPTGPPPTIRTSTSVTVMVEQLYEMPHLGSWEEVQVTRARIALLIADPGGPIPHRWLAENWADKEYEPLTGQLPTTRISGLEILP
jgi:hypothetical protein